MTVDTYVFHHIPKTGGSTFWHNLAESKLENLFFDDLHYRLETFGLSDLGHFIPHHINTVTQEVYESHFFLPVDAKLFIHHHDPFPLEDLLPGCRYLGLLRDPVDRCLSEIRHMVANSLDYYNQMERMGATDPYAIYLGDAMFMRKIGVPADTFQSDAIASVIFDRVLKAGYDKYYRRFFTSVFGSDFRKSEDVIFARSEPLAREELLPTIRDRYEFLFILTKNNGFRAAEIESFKKRFQLRDFNPSASNHKETMTNADVLPRSVQNELRERLTPVFAEETAFFEELADLAAEKAADSLAGLKRTVFDLGRVFVPEGRVRTCLHHTLEAGVKEKEAALAMSQVSGTNQKLAALSEEHALVVAKLEVLTEEVRRLRAVLPSQN